MVGKTIFIQIGMEEGNEIFGENIEKSRANGCLHSRAYI